MKYKLKKGIEAFQVVDGPFAGRSYAQGKMYDEIPPREKQKFEIIEPVQGSRFKGSKVKKKNPEPLNPEPLNPEPLNLQEVNNAKLPSDS